MSRIDRIAEPWGTRTPYGPGEQLLGRDPLALLLRMLLARHMRQRSAGRS
jgi:hypothetical protein